MRSKFKNHTALKQSFEEIKILFDENVVKSSLFLITQKKRRRKKAFCWKTLDVMQPGLTKLGNFVEKSAEPVA